MDLTIGQVAAQTGVDVGTLRMWEARHGLPSPRRLPAGHRRYSEADVEQIRELLRARDAGLSLPAAVARARAVSAEEAPHSIHAGLRRARPDLQPRMFSKRVLIGLSRAIEDECAARAERALLFASFQQERFYRASERRWRELSRSAELAVAFADFRRVRRPPRAPAEVPVDRSDVLAREWAVVCDAPGFGACLAARERPSHSAVPDAERSFETVWSAERGVVRTATLIALRLAQPSLPELAPRGDALTRDLAPPPDDVRQVTDLANRMLAYVGARA